MYHPIEAGQFADLPNGTRLHYAACGDRNKPLLLLMHGFPEAWFAWEGVMNALTESHFVVAPDLRGFGLSSKPADPKAYKIKPLVEDVRLLIAHFGAQNAAIAAHDWGGAVAWNVAIWHPQLVNLLMIVNAPHPYLFAKALALDEGQRAGSAYMNWLRADGVETPLRENNFARMKQFFEGHGQAPAEWFTPELAERYVQMWSTPGDAASDSLTGGLNYYRASPLFPAPPTAPQLYASLKAEDWQVRIPTRVLWAEGDRALRPVLLDGLADLVADLEIVRVPDAGHWVIHERPEFVATQLAQWLKPSAT